MSDSSPSPQLQLLGLKPGFQSDSFSIQGGRGLREGVFRLRLFKENLKFSAAHFLIFDSLRAERLHGHNYKVRVELEFPLTSGSDIEKNLAHLGYILDFKTLKIAIKKCVDQWDEMILLPSQHPEMHFEVSTAHRPQGLSSICLHFRDRYYVFPQEEVQWLPVVNVSVEQLSRTLALQVRELCSELFSSPSLHPQKICVDVEEISGQAASFVS